MASSLVSIADIFERKLLRIPDYQRGYSWGDRQLTDFWDDLIRMLEGKNHYTGLITLMRVNFHEGDDIFGKWENDKWLLESGFNPYYLVDGQQRITTVMLLIHEILRKIGDDDELAYESKKSILSKYITRTSGSKRSYIFGYEYNDPSDKYLKSVVFGDESIGFDNNGTLYTKNLGYAVQFFNDKLKNLGLGDLDKLYKKLTLRLQFNIHEIKEELDEFVVFETTNNRGKPLSKLELLKNRLIYLSTIIPNYERELDSKTFEEAKLALRRAVNETWKTIYGYLGLNPENPLDDDDFLRNHFYVFYGYDTNTAAHVDRILLDEKFTAKDAQDRSLSFKDIEHYINSLSDAAKHWFRVNNPFHPDARFSEKLKTWLDKIHRQDYTPFYSCLLAALMVGSSDSQLLALTKKMERYYFLVFALSKRKSNTGTSLFYQRAHYLYDNEISFDDLLTEIDERIHSKSVGHDFTLDRFKERIIDDLFEGATASGMYGWPDIKYLLTEYELELQGENDRKIPSVITMASIEHIMPRSAENQQCWREKLLRYSKSEKNRLINSWGNFVVLSSVKNSRLSNRCFEEKKAYTRDGLMYGYINGSYSEIDVARLDDWGAYEIYKRSLRIFDFMIDRWRLNPLSDEQKANILGLSFVEEYRVKA